MGGGRLILKFEDGNIGAHFDAWADFLINYKPFMFMADMGVIVGASYVFKQWGITKKLEISKGCSLELHGPPLAGKVTVNWYVVSITIHFGGTRNKSAAVGWDDFTSLLIQNEGSAMETPTIHPLHTLATTSG